MSDMRRVFQPNAGWCSAEAMSIDGRFFKAYAKTTEEAMEKLTAMLCATEVAPGYPAGYDADGDAYWWTGAVEGRTKLEVTP